MKGYFNKKESRGLPGGPNQQFTYATGVFMQDMYHVPKAQKGGEGYRIDASGYNDPYKVIPSGNITMTEQDGGALKKGPLLGIDNMGNQQMMFPGYEYQFPGNMVMEIPVAQKGNGEKENKIKNRILKEYPGFENILNKTKYYKTDILDSSKTGFGDTETIFPNIDTVKYSDYKKGLKDLPNPNYGTSNYTVAYNPKNINLDESTIPLASELFHISNLDPVLKSLRQDVINAAYESDPYFKKDVKERIKEYPEYTKKEQEEIVADGYMRNVLYNSLLENTGKDYILKNNRYHPEEAKDISGFYQPMSNQIINYLQNPQGYPLPQVNVTAKRINKQKGGEFQRLVKKYTTQGWDSLNPQEQQFYRETYQRGGSIKLDPAKKGTFKALATKYGMSMDKLAMDMKKNPDKYSPEARKKANFYRNFVMQYGGATNFL